MSNSVFKFFILLTKCIEGFHYLTTKMFEITLILLITSIILTVILCFTGGILGISKLIIK